MTQFSGTDLNLLIETGRMLHEARVKQGLSMEDMCKKLGMRSDQIQAIEEGNAAFFQKSTQPLIWYARIYAKKLGVDLSNLVFNNIQHITRSNTQAPSNTIPPFLMKKNETKEQ